MTEKGLWEIYQDMVDELCDCNKKDRPVKFANLHEQIFHDIDCENDTYISTNSTFSFEHKISYKDAIQCIADVGYLLNFILTGFCNDSETKRYLREIMRGNEIDPRNVRNIVINSKKQDTWSDEDREQFVKVASEWVKELRDKKLI